MSEYHPPRKDCYYTKEINVFIPTVFEIGRLASRVTIEDQSLWVVSDPQLSNFNKFHMKKPQWGVGEIVPRLRHAEYFSRLRGGRFEGSEIEGLFLENFSRIVPINSIIREAENIAENQGVSQIYRIGKKKSKFIQTASEFYKEYVELQELE